MNKVRLGDMLTFQRGYDLTHMQMKGGKIPVVGSSEIIGWHDEVKVKSPVLLIGRSGTVGRPQFYETDVWAHNTTLFVSDFHGNNPKFCFYFLKNLNLEDYANSSGVPTLNRNFIHPLIVNFPDIETQQAIARVLSSLDDKIELNNKINAALEDLARTIYEYWFVQNAEKTWEKKSLYDIATFTNGLACQKFRPKRNDFYKVIKIKEMRDGFTKDSELVDVDIPEKVIVNDGDILFSWSASLEVIIWTGGVGGLNQHIFKVTSDEYPKSFIYFQLLNYLSHFRTIADNRKTTMGHITIDHLKQSEIYIPPTNIINIVDKIVSPLFSSIIKNRQESAHLAQLRDFLLPLLMNGQVKMKEKLLET